MIILIHGTDNAKSRQKLKEIDHDKNQETVYFDGKKASLVDLTVASESSSLLSDKKTIVIENFFQRKIGKEKAEIQEYLFKNTVSHLIIFWENKPLEKTKLSKLPKGFTEFKFEYPASLFKFLDSLGSQPVSQALISYHAILKTSDPELVFTMIVRQFRFLIMVKEEEKNGLAIPDWQYYKFKAQAQKFDMEKLIFLYRQLLSLDYKQKSGITPFTKSQLLDIFLASI